MPSKKPHQKVLATKQNFDADSRNKMKLDYAFREFSKQVKDAAKESPAVAKLMVPLKRLEKAVIIGAYGVHFVVGPIKKKY